MIFTESPLEGVYIVELERRQDNRGYFARAFCRREFMDHGLDPDIVQCNLSYNQFKGTLRGMHYQMVPHQEVKYIRCVSGRIYDVVVDLRENSSSYGKWFGIELGFENGKALYIPKGFAHGYLTLEDHSVVYYQTTEAYHPESERGLYYADETIGIEWPITENLILSEKDKSNRRLEQLR